jgi:hypothetical protein
MPTELIDWLLESNNHFIITHINQGRSSHGLIWCMRDILDQLNRLFYHAGCINKLNEGSLRWEIDYRNTAAQKFNDFIAM